MSNIGIIRHYLVGLLELPLMGLVSWVCLPGGSLAIPVAATATSSARKTSDETIASQAYLSQRDSRKPVSRLACLALESHRERSGGHKPD